jgi:hypothetical protein
MCLPGGTIKGREPNVFRTGVAAFTLAEVLVSLAFMAIVIPVALEGMHIASGAGEIAARKTEAAMVAERVLNETIVTGEWYNGIQSGSVRQGLTDYAWSLNNQVWLEDVNQTSIRQITVEVGYVVRDQLRSVRLSTLVDESQYLTNSTMR